jgi:hypothetical protein
MNNNFEDLASILAKWENTQELVDYWKSKFLKVLSSKQAILSDKTIELITSQELQSKPFTPALNIDLIKFFDNTNSFDENSFLETVETSTRLLDNAILAINFDEKAKQIVNQYRKIALSIINFERFLELRNVSDSKLEEVDYIGNLLSSQAYRASESIAEEKGVCLSWNLIKRNLRPKSFEFWMNTKDNSFEDALTIWETMGRKVPDQIWEIIPRRNSHLLSYPEGEEWLIWSDRDEQNVEQVALEKDSEPVTLTAPVDIKDHLLESKDNFLKLKSLEKAKEELITKNNFADKNSDVEPSEIEELVENKSITHPISISQIENKTHKIEVKSLEHYTELNQVEDVNKTESNNSEKDSFEIEVPNIKLSSQSELNFDNNSRNISDDNIETDNKIDHNLNVDTNIATPNIIENPTPQYQIGELVTIINKDSFYYNQTGQVIAFDYDDNQYYYTIRSTDSKVEKELWQEDDITSVDLFEILEKINEKDLQSNNKESFKIIVSSFILNEKNELLLEKTSDNEYSFPFAHLPYNTIPEQMVSPLLRDKYSLEIKNIREIGSSIELEKNGQNAVLNLSFYSDLVSVKETDNLVWIDLKQAQFSTNSLIRVICNKYSRSQLAIMNNKVDTQNSIEYQSGIENIPINNPQNQTTKNMIQYILKLQQLVQNESFGEVTVNLRYNSNGPQIEEIKSDKINDEVSYLSNVVISFCNYILQSQTSPKAIATIISTIPQNQTSMPFNEFMNLMIEILEDLPANPSEVKLS